MKRCSHDHLMAAAQALGKASEVELEAGNREVGMALNDSAIATYALALNVDIPDASHNPKGKQT